MEITKMDYKKTQPEITFEEFLTLVNGLKTFKSLKGNQYEVISIDDYSIISFIRKSSGKIWKMDLKGVLKAYKELDDFKTANFKSYVPRHTFASVRFIVGFGFVEKVKSKINRALSGQQQLRIVDNVIICMRERCVRQQGVWQGN